MIEIVVWLTRDYKKNESLYVKDNLTTSQIIDEVNKHFEIWYYYDIILPT